LVVIVVIGVLAGITINVININAQRQRANEAVVRTNVGKICSAVSSCYSTRIGLNTNVCDEASELGTIIPTEPDLATYSISDLAGSETLGSGYVLVTGSTNGCVVECFVRNDLGSDTIGGTTAQSGQVVNQTTGSTCLTE